MKDKYNVTIYNQYVCAVMIMHGIEENIDNVKSCCPKNKVSIIEEALKHVTTNFNHPTIL